MLHQVELLMMLILRCRGFLVYMTLLKIRNQLGMWWDSLWSSFQCDLLNILFYGKKFLHDIVDLDYLLTFLSDFMKHKSWTIDFLTWFYMPYWLKISVMQRMIEKKLYSRLTYILVLNALTILFSIIKATRKKFWQLNLLLKSSLLPPEYARFGFCGKL